MKITSELLVSLSACAYSDELYDVSNALLAIVDLLPTEKDVLHFPLEDNKSPIDINVNRSSATSIIASQADDHIATVVPISASL